MGSRKFLQAENFAQSGAAAIIWTTAVAPVERVRLLIQNQDEIVKAGRLSEPYRGVVNCLRHTFRTEGILAFWRGNLAACLRYFPAQALTFAFNEKFKAMRVFRPTANDSNVMKFSRNWFSGSMAGIMTISFIYTLDFARTRLATDVKAAGLGGAERQFSGLINVYTKTLKSDGIVGLHRGFLISCVGLTVYRGFYFGLYNSLKPLMLGENTNIIVSFCLGYSVAVISGLLCYPMDTVRRRMMMRSGQAVKYKGSMDCAKQIIRNEGFMSLMKGASINIVLGVAGGLMLQLFDSFKRNYTRWHRKD